MSDNDTNATAAPTRRDTIKYGGAVVGGGLLAGCSSQSDSGKTPEATDTGNATEETPTDEADSEPTYSATMSPIGTVEFDAPPESVVPALQFGADLMVALGQWDCVEWMGNKQNVAPNLFEMVPGFDGLELEEAQNLSPEGTNDKELYYEADPDLFAFDPNLTIAFDNGFDVADVNEVADIAPWFGNHSRRLRDDSWYQWPDGEPYEYVGMYEQVEKYGQLLGAGDRATALRDLHDELIESIQADLPPEDDRPTIALPHAIAPRDGSIWTYNPLPGNSKVYGTKQYQDLQVRDAFAGKWNGQSTITIDAEALLEVDPDVIFLHFGISFLSPATEFFDDDAADGKMIPEYTMYRYRNDPVLSELSAIQDDRLYVGHTGQQGPLTNLLQTEMFAKQLYPDIYGEFPGVDDDGTWDISAGEQLFDRERLADIINGDI